MRKGRRARMGRERRPVRVALGSAAQLGNRGGNPVVIGRQEGCSIRLDDATKAVSGIHAEIRLLDADFKLGEAAPRLCVVDRSTNGSGIRRPGAEKVFAVPKKGKDMLPHMGLLQIPFKAKKSAGASTRVSLFRIIYDDLEVNSPNEEAPAPVFQEEEARLKYYEDRQKEVEREAEKMGMFPMEGEEESILSQWRAESMGKLELRARLIPDRPEWMEEFPLRPKNRSPTPPPRRRNRSRSRRRDRDRLFFLRHGVLPA